MANLPVITLNSGKLTPLIDARSDVEKYGGGCRELQNMIPLVYGPVTRRPGTLRVANCYDHDVKSRMVKFIYSSTIAYKLEFSNKILNVYYEQTLVDTLATSYLEADLPELQFEQSADVMWIVHPEYHPAKLTRTDATTFALNDITFESGPFIERNDIAEDDGVTIKAVGYTIATATAGAPETGNFTIEGSDEDDAIATGALFTANTRFYIDASDSETNDGAWTVHESKATDVTGTTVTIYTNETIAGGIDDGEIQIAGGEVTLTASAATFTTGTSGHTGSLFKLTHKRLQTITKIEGATADAYSSAIDVKGSWSFTTHGNWDGVVEIQRLEDGTNWETFRSYTSTMVSGTGSRNIQKSDVEETNGVQYRIFFDYTDGSLDADLVVDESTQDSIFKITATASTTSATATAIIPAPYNEATKRWAEGSWSAVRGYPATVTFFEERIVYGFTDKDAQTIWLSETGKFENFDEGINDADSFAITLPTADHGRWLGSLEALAAGTTGGEWRIRSSAEDEPLTPKNWSMKEQTTFGSANIQAMEVNEAIIFVDFVARKVREFTWSDMKQKYVSPDLTVLAEDITSGGITSMAVQKRPDSILWFTIADSPYLISMTYEREQNVVAFAEHPLGGDGIAESVCVTPGADEDVITLTAQWTIDGDTKRYILDMQPRDWGSTTLPDNAFFVDCGIVDTGGDTTIDGLDHLEGETVCVLVDGAVQANKVVLGGEITVDEAGDRAVVGLPYTYKVSPMRLDINTKSGTTLGVKKQIPNVSISFFATGNAQYGDGTTQYDINWRTTEPYGTPPVLFTGIKENLAFDGGFSTEDNLVISGSDPLPCTVRAIVPNIQIG